MGRRGFCFALALAAGLVGAPAQAQDDPACRVIQFDMSPTDDLQIVIWIEDSEGNYVDTTLITRLTGSLGLGNRPGMMEFNSGPLWPYGRRTTTFPIWAGRHGQTWPLVVFQNEDDGNLSHPLSQSSREDFFCRPIREDESLWDALSCATTVFTDKGALSTVGTSQYPPRSDVSVVAGIDDTSVGQMAGINPFDVVSRATPAGGLPFSLSWAIPDSLPNGDYVAWVEVAKEFDQNAFYDYPEPIGIPWAEYGIAYRGQPSVVYSVPFTVDVAEFTGATESYLGYGDPDGIDNDIRLPDGTITEGIDGTGAGRLVLEDDGERMYRFKVSSRPAFDDVLPGAPTELTVVAVTTTSLTATFVSPGDDGMEGTPTGYEVRYMAGTEITEANFADATLAGASIPPGESGTVQMFTLNGLVHSTNYYVAVRAFDDCLNPGPIVVVQTSTPPLENGTVDACFVATAAFGSLLANEVVPLRKFRDLALRTHVTGELIVEGYYTFGPLLARMIEPSDLLRRLARAALAPAVAMATELVPKIESVF